MGGNGPMMGGDSQNIFGPSYAYDMQGNQIIQSYTLQGGSGEPIEIPIDQLPPFLQEMA